MYSDFFFSAALPAAAARHDEMISWHRHESAQGYGCVAMEKTMKHASNSEKSGRVDTGVRLLFGNLNWLNCVYLEVIL